MHNAIYLLTKCLKCPKCLNIHKVQSYQQFAIRIAECFYNLKNLESLSVLEKAGFKEFEKEITKFEKEILLQDKNCSARK
jgi:hypothetical protein